ncbi:glycosyltransferase [Spirosoma arboris]|nr:glycosyltransferase [Spirosoma arboris]
MNPESGGVSQAIKTLIEETSKLDVISHLAVVDSPDALYLQNEPLIIYALGPSKGVWQYSKLLLPWLIENLINYEVVIVHGLWLYHSYSVLKASKLVERSNHSRPKIYIMPHGMLDPWFQEAQGRKLKAIRNWLYWKIIEKRVVNELDGLLFTCETEMLLAQDTFSGYKPKMKKVVGLGIEAPPVFTKRMSDLFYNKCEGLKNENYILFLGRIHVKKGVDLLVNAYLALEALGTKLPKLVIAGPGLETDYGKKIQALASKSNSIYLPGMLNGEIKWGAFYCCEAFILPSHQENFGIAVAESLACSKPVLISNQVNIWREIEVGQGGIIFSDSLEGTQTALEQWFSLSLNQKKVMGLQAKAVYESKFAVDSTVRRFMEAISV